MSLVKSVLRLARNQIVIFGNLRTITPDEVKHNLRCSIPGEPEWSAIIELWVTMEDPRSDHNLGETLGIIRYDTHPFHSSEQGTTCSVAFCPPTADEHESMERNIKLLLDGIGHTDKVQPVMVARTRSIQSPPWTERITQVTDDHEELLQLLARVEESLRIWLYSTAQLYYAPDQRSPEKIAEWDIPRITVATLALKRLVAFRRARNQQRSKRSSQL